VRRILCDCVAVGLRRRGVVDGGDGDCNRRGVAARGAVVGLIRERYSAVEVRRRGVAERAVGLQRQRPAADRVDQNGRQRMRVGVRIVGQHAGRGDVQRLIFVDGIAIAVRYGRHVDPAAGGGDADRGYRNVAQQPALARLIGERIVADESRMRDIQKSAVCSESEHQDPVGWVRYENGLEGFATDDARIVAEDTDVGRNRQHRCLGSRKEIVDRGRLRKRRRDGRYGRASDDQAGPPNGERTRRPHRNTSHRRGWMHVLCPRLEGP
jgi:hypothetical protein